MNIVLYNTIKNSARKLTAALTVLLMSTVVWSCSDTEEPQGPVDGEVTIQITPMAGSELVTLGETSGTVVFPKQGGTVKLVVITQSDWDYKYSTAEWLNVSKENNILTMVAEPNVSIEDFSVNVTLTAGSGTITATYSLEVHLSSQDFAFSPPLAEFTFMGGTIPVNIIVDEPEWEITNSIEWVDYQIERNVVTLTAEKYFEVEGRSAELHFAAGDKTGTLSIIQEGAGETFVEVEPVEGLIFIADGEELSAVVYANREWTLTSDIAWLEITEVTDDGFKAKASPNYYAVQRDDFIFITAGQGDEQITQRVFVGQQAQPEAEVETEDVAFGPQGGSYEIEVATNQETWTYQVDAPSWLTVTRDGNKLSVQCGANSAADLRTANITVTAGRPENQAEGVYNVKQLTSANDNALIYELTVPAGAEAMLPLYWVIINYGTHKEVSGYVDAIVDWGDGTYENVKDRGYPTHVYETAGVYDVRILGEVHMLRSPNSVGFGFGGITEGTEAWNKRGYFTAVKQWGNLGYVQIDYACYHYHKLKSVAGDPNGSFAGVDYLPYMFQGCTSLEEIPGNIFSHISKIRPSDLSYSASFSQIFTDCSSLKKVPAGLFANNPLIESLSMCFERCYALEEIEPGAFGQMPNLVSMVRTFRYCRNLKKVPVDIFDGMRNVDTFQWCFYDCKLEGESPYTMINGNKVHLYERINYPTEFAPPVSYETHGGLYGGVFYNCTALSDYATMPQFWKEEWNN